MFYYIYRLLSTLYVTAPAQPWPPLPPFPSHSHQHHRRHHGSNTSRTSASTSTTIASTAGEGKKPRDVDDVSWAGGVLLLFLLLFIYLLTIFRRVHMAQWPPQRLPVHLVTPHKCITNTLAAGPIRNAVKHWRVYTLRVHVFLYFIYLSILNISKINIIVIN
jgi:hypothetical protein